MRIYPKGCRYIFVSGGTAGMMRKFSGRVSIDTLFASWGTTRDSAHIVVQPRGKKKWWLFRQDDLGPPRFVATAHEPDSLVMRAILGV